ncbi:MAG TPA: peptidyl-prolyl cis-trans isomerase [Vicinamibacterales bacterium]|nr:peptidyl-prolyl cis-trans isomerase [Vicinamibacterales bacterium]
MTMLDRMRQHRNWLKWSLGIVVAAFVLLYVPSFLRPGGPGTLSTDVLATVDGREVLMGSYQRAYQSQVNSLRSAYGDKFDEGMLRQLGIPQRIVQQLIDEEAVLAEADRLGVSVSDAELNERIVRMPGFQENGHFVGYTRYQQILQYQRPPLRPSEFEASFRNELIAEKLQAAVTGWVRVADNEVDEEYRHRNEKVKLDLAVFTANQFRAGIQPTDAELNAQFSAHQDTYKMPEKRRVRYLSIDAEALRPKMVATDPEIEARYKDNLSTYSTPEQIRASHILFKTEGKDEAAVKKLAETVLAKVKAGGDFAALAKQYSDDDMSKKNGGDLDYFGRGTMVKEFDEAAWALQPGQISDLVKSQFGFHIIKVVDKKPATTKTLAEVRPQLEDQIKLEKAQAEAQKTADALTKEITTPADLDRVAKARGLTVGDSGLFAREEPLAGIGFAPAVSAQAFTMEKDKVSGELRTNTGLAFIALTEIKPPAMPTLAEVKDKVRDDVVKAKAVELAKAKAATMAQAAKGNFAAAAKAAGVEVKSTDFVTRGTPYPEVGVSSTLDGAVFSLKAGDTTGPIPTDNAVVVARVKERQDLNPATMATERENVRAQLVEQRRGEFFSAYMAKAKAKLKIGFNENAIRTIIGS